jgi:hypothetical protein
MQLEIRFLARRGTRRSETRNPQGEAPARAPERGEYALIGTCLSHPYLPAVPKRGLLFFLSPDIALNLEARSLGSRKCIAPRITTSCTGSYKEDTHHGHHHPRSLG